MEKYRDTNEQLLFYAKMSNSYNFTFFSSWAAILLQHVIQTNTQQNN